VLLSGQQPGGGVSAFRVAAGCAFQPSWRTVVGLGTEPPPIVLGDVLFTAGGRGVGYAALDARTGRELWSFPTDAFTLAPTIAVGNLIVTADYSGVVRVFGPPTPRGSG
jgi:outer membrane protein assembly factor BamB